MTFVFDNVTKKFKKQGAASHAAAQIPKKVADFFDLIDGEMQIELRADQGKLEWKRKSSAEWQFLTALPTDGKDGLSPEMREYSGFIEWRLQGEQSWQRLVKIPRDGANGKDGLAGPRGDNGENGKSVELRTSGGYVEWRYTDAEDWKRLYQIPRAASGGGAGAALVALDKLKVLFAGGATGQALIKNSSNDFDFSWQTIISGVTSVFGRAGAVVAQAGDYAFDQISGLLNLGTQVTGDLPFTNIQQIATARFLGRNSAGTGDIEELTAATARTMLGYELGVATNEVIVSQPVAAFTNFTQNIPLTSGTWTNGKMVVLDTTAGGSGSGAIIHFTDVTSQSSGQSGSIFYNSYLITTINTLITALNQGSGRVTSGAAFSGGTPGTGAFQITSVRINGTNLEVIWRNNTGTTQTINARIRYYLMRGNKVLP